MLLAWRGTVECEAAIVRLLVTSPDRCWFACSECCSAILHSHLKEGVGCTIQPWSGTLDDSQDELSPCRQTDHTGHVRYTVYQHYRHLLHGRMHPICKTSCWICVIAWSPVHHYDTTDRRSCKHIMSYSLYLQEHLVIEAHTAQ